MNYIENITYLVCEGLDSCSVGVCFSKGSLPNAKEVVRDGRISQA